MPLPQLWFDVLDQYLAENVGPAVVIGDPHPLSCRCREPCAVAVAARYGGKQIDPGIALERRRYRQPLRLGKWIGDLAAKRKSPDAGCLRGMGDHGQAISHDRIISLIG